MGYAVEMNLDAVGAARVRALWRTLAQVGVTDNMLRSQARPHVSLAVFEDDVDLDALRAALAEFTAGMPPLRLKFSSVGVFAAEAGVLFLAPVVTEGLLAVHSDLHGRCAARGLVSHGYYLPGVWVPHCTVGYGLASEALPTAVVLALAANVFGEVLLDAVSLTQFPSARLLADYPLTS